MENRIFIHFICQAIKRQDFLNGFPDPYSIDITEIDGFDNLHHAEGILKESMERAAEIYGADQTCYLVNGSTCGILSAVCGSTAWGGKLLMARNCHKSAYHGLILNHLEPVYVYPSYLEGPGISGGVCPSDVRRILEQDKKREIQAVLVVSPTYEGVVSDIAGIAAAAHEHGIPLIVDEAHGAHLPFGGRENGFPEPALSMGADVVIQSLHKTLPCFTQTGGPPYEGGSGGPGKDLPVSGDVPELQPVLCFHGGYGAVHPVHGRGRTPGDGGLWKAAGAVFPAGKES